MAGLRVRALGLIAPEAGAADVAPWDRIPALVSAAFVVVPVAAVPAMGFGVILTGDHGMGWTLIAALLSLIGLAGLVMLLAGAVAAIRSVRSPLPLLMVATGTTIALVAGVLLVPVLMAAIGLGG
jgi:hypothetical protein